MILDRDSHNEKKREMRNILSNLNNVIHTLIVKQESWDNKIRLAQGITELVPYLVRYLIYFKNTEGDSNE